MKRNITGIIKSSKSAMTKNGNPYQVVVILNSQDGTTNTIQVSVWGSLPHNTPYGKQISATISDDDGFLSCALPDIRITEPTEELKKLLPQPPSENAWDSVISMISQSIMNYPSLCEERGWKLSVGDPKSSLSIKEHYSNPQVISGTRSDDYKKLAVMFRRIAKNCYKPYSMGLGAVSNHHNFPGGLLRHTYEILDMFAGIYDRIPFQVNPFIVAFACLFHDFGKLECYTSDFQYTESISVTDHTFVSAESAGEVLRQENVSNRLIKFVQSAILSHHGRLEWGAPILPVNLESFLTAKLDELSGHGEMYDKPSFTRSMNTTIQRF